MGFRNDREAPEDQLAEKRSGDLVFCAGTGDAEGALPQRTRLVPGKEVVTALQFDLSVHGASPPALAAPLRPCAVWAVLGRRLRGEAALRWPKRRHSPRTVGEQLDSVSLRCVLNAGPLGGP